MRKVIRKHLDLNLKFVSLGSFIGCLAVQVCIIKNSAFYKLRESDEKKLCKTWSNDVPPFWSVRKLKFCAAEKTYQIVIKNFHIWWQICIWAIKFYMHKLVMRICVGVCARARVRRQDSVGWDTKWDEMSWVACTDRYWDICYIEMNFTLFSTFSGWRRWIANFNLQLFWFNQATIA